MLILHDTSLEHSLLLLPAYINQKPSDAKDVQKAFTYLQISANKEYAPAMNMYGIYLEDGISDYKDSQEAFRYFLKASNQGYVPGIYNLGRCYFYGIGTDVNKQEAFELFCKASAMKYREALEHILYWQRSVNM